MSRCCEPPTTSGAPATAATPHAAGFITSAARANVHERDIMRHSRHKSLAVFRGYMEEAGLFDDNAACKVGL